MMQRPSGGRPPRAPVNKDAIGRAIKYLGRFKRQASLPYIFLVIATLSQLAVPKLVSGIIDAVSTGVAGKAVLDRLPSIPAGAVSSVLPQLLQFLKLPATLTLQQLTDTLNANVASAPSALLTAGIAIVVFSAFRGVFAFLQAYWAEKNSQQVAYDLRNELYEKVQRLSFSYYEKTQTGQLMIRATDDVEKLRLFIGQGLLQIVGALALIVGTLVILFTTNAQLALVVLPLLPVAMGLFMFFGAVSGPLFGKVQMRLSELNAVLQENLAGIKVVQAFVRERSEQDRFDASANKLLNQQLQISRLFTFLFPVIFLVANLGQSAVLYFGGRDIVLGNLTVGVWQEFSLYLVYLFLPIAQLGIIVTQLGQAAASATRIFEILDAKSDVVDKPGAPALPPVKGEIAFENVTFRYIGEGKPVLQNVSFTAHPGETVALLGATGSGKTSIINLLPRFYDPTEGAVKIDGHNLRDVTLESLRAQIGIVLQETTLFSGTIRDNIAYGPVSYTHLTLPTNREV